MVYQLSTSRGKRLRERNGRAGVGSGRPFAERVGALVGAVGSVSAGPDGERVKVVGQDRPFGPDPLAVVALGAAAAHAVAALEVADAALGAGAVALQSALGAPGAGLLAAGDEHSLRGQVGEAAVGRAGHEAAIERDLARAAARRRSGAAARSRPRCPARWPPAGSARAPRGGCARSPRPAG
jgi:hypothetical protein